MSQPFQSLQSDNWVHISVKPGEKPLFDARGEGVNELRNLVDGVLGEGTFDFYVRQFANTIVDSGVAQLQAGGLAATPVASQSDTPPFVPGAATGPTPSFVPAGTPQATFDTPKTTGPTTLGQYQGYDVILWKDGKFGPNVALKGANGPDGKPLRASLAKGESADSVTLDRAIQLLASRNQYLAGKQG